MRVEYKSTKKAYRHAILTPNRKWLKVGVEQVPCVYAGRYKVDLHLYTLSNDGRVEVCCYAVNPEMVRTIRRIESSHFEDEHIGWIEIYSNQSMNLFLFRDGALIGTYRVRAQ